MRNVILAGVASAVILASTGAFAAEPARSVSARRHLNITAAQRLAEKALVKVVAAQKADEYDVEGHAEKAKALLEQVNAELKQAVEANKKATQDNQPWAH